MRKRGSQLRMWLIPSWGGEYGGWDPDPHLSSVREGDKEDDALRGDDDGCLGRRLSRRCGKGS